ncbi:uncharacterized protein LACBIDRAFT_308109 [Laccaria bicolor S238N-H82]|uniref:Predicted protein n=1 Tax=Laccaria bicolor (strain S238N-H82 / ATCC MYA-4686) TaxID=486041 RepID=B0DRN7_LACBS|nr:uncharacterized protein LACBIDRAFT_308109 [Laccaria bicolor S238N-H82]EDR02818.1 predicted protein [Laccaria bicolor S238N-H82]|eukprot:XP_001886528.1 predicted protein [Laccaria bicolor S238N-H82]
MSPECKRRKIKCDRTQPCAPCTRRGEQSKCQWHIVEPVEKYVTRAEYDELKGRFEQLDALVRRLLPTTTVASTSMPYYQLAHTGAGGASGVSVEAVQTYNPSTTPGVSGPIAGYPSMMPPPPPPPQGTYPQHIETSNQAPHRYIKTDDLQSGARHQNVYHPASTSMGGPVTSPLLSTATHHTLPQHSPLLPSSPSRSHYRRSPEMLRSPSTTSATIKSSALSLSSITSPYNVNPDQSKNYHAQTLTLGERLRPEFQAPSGPVVLFLGMVRQQRGRRLRGCTLTPVGRVGSISNSKRARRRPLFNFINLLLNRHGGTAIHPP